MDFNYFSPLLGIATQCCSPAGPPSLRDGFLRGGLKGNDQKKYTLEVKTVKARKSDGWCKNGAKSTTIWNQTLIVRNSG